MTFKAYELIILKETYKKIYLRIFDLKNLAIWFLIKNSDLNYKN